MRTNPGGYCLKACNKIGYFIQLIHNVDIMRMKVEFFQDENGLVQFYHAKDVWIRCLESQLSTKQESLLDAKKAPTLRKNPSQQQSTQVEALKLCKLGMLLDQVIEDLGVTGGEEESSPGIHQNSQEGRDAKDAKPKKKGRLFRLMEDMNSKLDHINTGK